MHTSVHASAWHHVETRASLLAWLVNLSMTETNLWALSLLLRLQEAKFKFKEDLPLWSSLRCLILINWSNSYKCPHCFLWSTKQNVFWNRHFCSPHSYSVVVLLERLFLQPVCTRRVYPGSFTAFRRYCVGKMQPDDRIKNKQGQMLSEMWL